MATEIVLCSFCEVLSGKWDDVKEVGQKLSIPTFDEGLLVDLCNEAAANLAAKPTLLRLTGEFVVVGDLHGSLHDLLRIFKEFGLPPMRRYLFLGDYVDRGNFSIEVISLLLALSNRFPENVFMIRGNHEFFDVYSKYGFLDDITTMFSGTRLVTSFNNVFSELPLAATINDKFFCCHGGLSQHLYTLDQIESLRRPIHSDKSTAAAPFLKDLLWADPSEDFGMFAESRRGEISTYGKDAVRKFLQRNNLVAVIRAHEYCQEGLKAYFNRGVVTVFSASAYKKNCENKSGVLVIGPDGLSGRRFDQIPKIPREFCMFFTMKKPEPRVCQPGKNGVWSCHSLRSFKNCPLVKSNMIRPGLLKAASRIRFTDTPSQPRQKSLSVPACCNTFCMTRCEQ